MATHSHVSYCSRLSCDANGKYRNLGIHRVEWWCMPIVRKEGRNGMLQGPRGRKADRCGIRAMSYLQHGGHHVHHGNGAMLGSRLAERKADNITRTHTRRNEKFCVVRASQDVGEVDTQTHRAAMVMESSIGDNWNHTLLLRRQLNIAVKEEDYTRASQIQLEIQVMLERISPFRVYLYKLLETIQDGSSSERKVLDALDDLSLHGDFSVLPEIYGLLTSRPRMENDIQRTYKSIRDSHISPLAAELCRSGMSHLVSAALGPGQTPDQESVLVTAVGIFTAALEEDARCTTALAGRGTAFYHLKKYENAIEDLEEATHMDPFDHLAAHMLALAKGQLKEFDCAYRILSSTLLFNASLENSLEHKAIFSILQTWEKASLSWKSKFREARDGASACESRRAMLERIFEHPSSEADLP